MNINSFIKDNLNYFSSTRYFAALLRGHSLKFYNMKKWDFLIAIDLILISLFLNSCTVVTGIFKAGMGFGIFIFLVVIIVIGFIAVKANKK